MSRPGPPRGSSADDLGDSARCDFFIDVLQRRAAGASAAGFVVAQKVSGRRHSRPLVERFRPRGGVLALPRAAGGNEIAVPEQLAPAPPRSAHVVEIIGAVNVPPDPPAVLV